MPRNNLTCPHCGGTMDYLENKKIYRCRYCDYQESEQVNLDEEIERARKEERLSAKEEFLNERERNLNEREYNERRNPSRTYVNVPVSRQPRRRKNPTGCVVGALMGVILFLTLMGSCLGAIKLISDEGGIDVSSSSQTEINPFENLTIKVEGLNHKGKIYLSDKMDDVSYEISKESNLSNGDVVTIKASPRSYKYKLTQKEFQYTVEGLTILFTSKDEITKECWEKIKTFSATRLEKSTYGTSAKVESTPYRLYMMTIDGENRFFDCYKTKVSLTDDSAICYQVIVHKNARYTNKNNKLIVLEDECRNCSPIISLYTEKKSYCGAFSCFKTIEDFETHIKADYPEMDSFEMIFENK